jgi:hypothetical protein
LRNIRLHIDRRAAAQRRAQEALFRTQLATGGTWRRSGIRDKTDDFQRHRHVPHQLGRAAIVANTVISATVFNALTADLATGLTTCITKDGRTTTPTANIPMGGNKITGLAVGTLATDAANLRKCSPRRSLITPSGVDTITGTMSPVLAAYAAGQMFYSWRQGLIPGRSRSTLTGWCRGGKPGDGASALAAGDINSGEIVVVVYDGTRFQMVNAANSFGNTTINGTLTVTGNAGFQANVSACLCVIGSRNAWGQRQIRPQHVISLPRPT